MCSVAQCQREYYQCNNCLNTFVLLDITLETNKEGEIVIQSSQRHCHYKKNNEELICHSVLKTGDIGEWIQHEQEDWLLWKGRHDDVVKILGK